MVQVTTYTTLMGGNIQYLRPIFVLILFIPIGVVLYLETVILRPEYASDVQR